MLHTRPYMAKLIACLVDLTRRFYLLEKMYDLGTIKGLVFHLSGEDD